MRHSSCNMTAFARKVREARKLRPKVATDMRPLFNHMLKLAIHSAKRGYCLRAGGEVARARQMATKYPAGLSGSRRKPRRRR